ncbi:YezD family protein [Methylomonas sp. HW2-6]|uniref:YezD family protein n=1 Tax=Methylomonas sp. HW2-6 TaxID=3376687 RepID=UPI0040432D71
MQIQFETDFSTSAQQQELVRQVIAILRGMRFGSVEIVVHDGRVVQIEKHEKFRVKSA